MTSGAFIQLLEPIWERQSGESSLWYSRFQEYFLMGSSRSALAVYKRFRSAKVPQKRLDTAGYGLIKSVPQSWRHIAERWQWRKRAEAWDIQQVEEQRLKWQEQAENNREREHKIGNDLMIKAEHMLAFPLTKIEYPTGYEIVRDPVEGRRIMHEAGIEIEQIEEAGGAPIVVIHITHVYPVGWRFIEAARMAEIGVKLKRQATGSPTSYIQQEFYFGSENKNSNRSLFPLKE